MSALMAIAGGHVASLLKNRLWLFDVTSPRWATGPMLRVVGRRHAA